MKQLLLLLMAILLTKISFAQQTGIHFEQNQSWNQVQEKAKKEHKYIFVDCYATWCGPCKAMDQDIYPDTAVGNFYNKHFISVKIQMDSTGNDNQEVKNWYTIAKQFQKAYLLHNGILSFPSFLYFTSEGRLVNQWTGFLVQADLIKIGKETFDPQKQLVTLINMYRSHQLKYKDMPFLNYKLSVLQIKPLRDSVSYDYIHNHLYKLPDNELFTRDNLIFIEQNTRSIDKQTFQFMRMNSSKINQAVGDNTFAEKSQIKMIVNSEVIPQTLKRKLKLIEWKKLENKLIKQYGNYGRIAVWQERISTDLAINSKVPNWTDYPRAFQVYFKSAGPYFIFDINQTVWTLFQHSNNKAALAYACALMKRHLNTNDVAELDTYANVLYKSGNKNEAILWEKKAMELSKANADKANAKPDPVFGLTLAKMQKGERTW